MPPTDDIGTLLARAMHRGSSLKSLTHNNRQAYAVVSSVLAKRKLLETALVSAGVPPDDASEDSHAQQLLMAHELLFGRGLRRFSRGRGASFDASLQRLRDWQRELLKSAKKRGANVPPVQPSLASERAAPLPAAGATASTVAKQLPRYVRVNTLKLSVAGALEDLQASGFRLVAARRETPPRPGEVWVDPLIPELLVLPEGTELHEHALVRSAALILQDKASCLSPAALDPPIGAVVVDATAAPGNKSTMLAARCHELTTGAGRVIACERDMRRAKTLEKRAALAAGRAVEVVCGDFLEIDPTAPPFSDATHLLLDPSCSGSGMVGQGAPEDTATDEASSAGDAPSGDGSGRAGDAPRLRGLAAMQLKLLLHALSFPRVATVVYSTCSVHTIEDELVVQAALEHADVQRRGWRLARALPAWPVRGLPVTPHASLCLRAGPEVMTNGFFVARFERGRPTGGDGR